MYIYRPIYYIAYTVITDNCITDNVIVITDNGKLYTVVSINGK